MPSPDSTTTGTSSPRKDTGCCEENDGGDENVPTSTGVELLLPEGNAEQGLHQEGECQDHKHEGRNRPRKRKLYAQICKQMEFYFSDANVTKNRMMKEIVEQANKKDSGYVDLNTFLEFTKIQNLTANLSHIQKALANSEKLELSPDKLKARRKIPFDANNVKSENDVEECTIYVENFPKEADHEWLERIFQVFGPLAYVSLPKFKNGQHKGFAFVEFDDVDAARRCVEAYGEDGARLPDDIDPSELRSIKSFKEQAHSSSNSNEAIALANAEVVSSSSKSEPGRSQKRKAEKNSSLPDDEDVPKSKKERREDSSSGVSEGEENAVANPDSNEVETSAPSKSKKNKKRKKNKAKKSGDAKLESESIMLKVLPKKSWRQLRNRYLNLQRSNMGMVKKHLQKEQLRAQHFKNFDVPPNTSHKHHHHHEAEFEVDNKPALDHVMEIRLKDPAESGESFRRKISVELAEQDEDEAMISGFIKFVDYKDGETKAYVRVNGDDSFTARAQNLLKKAKEEFISASFLSVSEIEEYKRNVQAALKQKQKAQPRKNIRGKDRLMKAATKSSHIYFGSDDEEQEEGGSNRKRAEMEEAN